MSSDLDALAVIPAKRLLGDSSNSTSPRIKRASTSELELDSSDEVALEASHLNIMDSPSPTAPASPLTTEIVMNNQKEEEFNPPPYEELEDVVETEPDETRPTPADQIAQINLLRGRALVKGDTWFLISRIWFRRWQTACSGIAESKEDDIELGVETLGPIDNSDIADEAGKLKRSMILDVNVIAVPEDAYLLLRGWYGSLRHVFLRSVINTPAYGSERIEFYPPVMIPYKIISADSTTSSRVPDYETVPTVPFSSIASLSHVKITLAYLVNAIRPIRLWRLPMDFKDEGLTYVLSDVILEGLAEPIEVGNITEYTSLNEAMLDDDINNLAIEEQGINGEWLERVPIAPTIVPAAPLFGANKFMAAPIQTTTVVTNNLIPRYKAGTPIATPSNSSHNNSFISNFANGLGMGTRAKSSARSLEGGLVGLQNLGNTCFMNSALQCMSNTKELQEYFTSGVYKTELNPDNPLGMNGQVAEAFGQLIQRMWSRNNSGAVAPREFKQALSKFAPSFSGYGQQDSQELLAFLLDGIHEDLNRIMTKPGTNAPDWHGGGDGELVEMAKTCWEQYRSRNDSVIVDLFQGQYRSTVVCPDCSKVSITFDPFMYVTTNLPVTKKWSGIVVFVALDPAKPRIRLTLEHLRTGTIKTLKIAVGGLVNCDPKLLFVIEEWQHKPWKTWTDDEQVIEVKDNDALIFHEIATPVPQLRQRSYGKSAPLPTQITTEAVPVILPVVQSAPIKQNFVKKFTAFKSAPDLFGSALILSLAPEETTSLDLIYRALIVRYAAISHKGAEMLETLQGALDLDGVSTELPSMDVDSPAEQPIASTSATLILDPTVFPPSPPPESNSAPRPKRHNPLFIIKVSKVTQARVPTAVDAFSKEAVNLETRLPVSTSPTSDIFPDATSTSLPGSFNPLRSDDKEQVSANSASTETTELDIPRVIVPLVRAGDFLTTEWTAGALQYFFGEDGSVGWGDLTDMIDPDIVAAKDLKGKKKTISIVDCLAEFTKEERLGEDDTWYCPDCKKHQQATKKVEIWKVPDVLVFNLKRFSASRYSRDKVEDLVDFPIDGFNLEPYVEGDKVERRLALSKGEGNSDEPDSLIYDLYAVDNHYGGLGGGHYTAYAKNHESGKWYDYDDSRVSEISPDRVVTRAAYLLFYRRRTTRPIGAKTRELIESALQSRNASLANSDSGRSPPASIDISLDSTSDVTNRFGSSARRGIVPDTDDEETTGGFIPDSHRSHSLSDFYAGERNATSHIRSASRSDSHSRRFNQNGDFPTWPSNDGSDTDLLSDTEADHGDARSRDEDEAYDEDRGSKFPLSSQFVEDDDEDLPIMPPYSRRREIGSPNWPEQDDEVESSLPRLVDEDYDAIDLGDSVVQDIVVDPPEETVNASTLYALD